jgi:hypothetical protein
MVNYGLREGVDWQTGAAVVRNRHESRHCIDKGVNFRISDPHLSAAKK